MTLLRSQNHCLLASIILVCTGLVACDEGSTAVVVSDDPQPSTSDRPSQPVTGEPTTYTIPELERNKRSHRPHLWLPDEHGLDGAEFLQTHSVDLALDASKSALFTLDIPIIDVRGCNRAVVWHSVEGADGEPVRCSAIRAYPSNDQRLVFDASVEGDAILVARGTVAASDDPEFCDAPDERPIVLTVAVRARSLGAFRLDGPRCPNTFAEEPVAGNVKVASPVDLKTILYGGYIVPLDSDGADFYPINRDPARPVAVDVVASSGVTVDEETLFDGVPGLRIEGVGTVTVVGATTGEATFDLVPTAHVERFEAALHRIAFVSKTGQPLSPALSADESYGNDEKWSSGLAYNVTNVESDGVAMCTSPPLEAFAVTSETPATCSGESLSLIADGVCTLRLEAAGFAEGSGLSVALSASFTETSAMKPASFHPNAYVLGSASWGSEPSMGPSAP